jgi:hypothetical protein
MNKRIFLVATGPSLLKTPLDALIGEDTFAINKIHRIYDRTNWRPTYLYYVDFTALNPKWRDPIDTNKGVVKHMWLLKDFHHGLPPQHSNYKDFPPEWALGDMPNVTWVPRCEKHRAYSAENPSPKAMHEWHLPDICTAYNGISPMIQVAVTMGYEEIYLVGCDLDYKPDWRLNHFDADYPEGNVPANLILGAVWADQDQKNAIYAHQIAKRECESRGVKICNCTVGGILEVYERKDLLDVIKS